MNPCSGLSLLALSALVMVSCLSSCFVQGSSLNRAQILAAGAAGIPDFEEKDWIKDEVAKGVIIVINYIINQVLDNK